MEIRLILPTPPSLNTLYAWNWRKRYKSEKYKEWIELAQLNYNQQERFIIEGDNWLEVEYKFYTKILNKDWSKKIKDVANYEKALSDFIADNLEWFSDHKIRKMKLEKIESWRDEVEIIIKEIC
mgnify:CR=1 FL=1